jgi:chitinase
MKRRWWPALLAVLALHAAPAGAYWAGGGAGSSQASVGTLSGGNPPSASVTGQTVTVTWTQTSFVGLPVGAYAGGGYTLQRYPAAGGALVNPGSGCAGIVSGAGLTLTCVETGVPAGQWQYTVSPLLGTWTGAESARSASLSVAPGAPVLGSASALNPPAGQATGDVALSWSAIAGAGGYNVYRRTASGTYSTALNASPVIGTSFTDTTLASGTYAYAVRAVTAGAESVDSNELTVTPYTRPASPASVTATPVAAGAISLTWGSVAGVTGYNIYRRTAAGTYDHSSPLNGSTPVSGTTFSDDTTLNAITYRYVVRAVILGAGGTLLESLADSPESAPAMSDGIAPGSVTISDPGSPLRGTITLSGTATDSVTGVAELRMQYAPAGTSSWTTGCTATTAPYSCSLSTAALADGLYDLRAQAVDVAGNVASSLSVANRRVDNAAPAVSVVDPGAYVRQTITISASASDAGSGVTSVTIQRAPTGTNTWTTICTDTSGAYSCALNTTTLADGGYDFRATATDAAGNTATSAILANRVVDNTAPTGIDIQTTNIAGGTDAKPETGDLITYSFSDPMSPASILAGWTGAITTVVVRFTNGNPDVVTVWNPTNTTQLALGSVRSGKKYVTGDVLFSGSTAVMNGSTIVVTLGVPNGSTATANGKTQLQWTVSTLATDLAGNPLTAGTVAETGATDNDF